MSPFERDDAAELGGRTLCDIARVLESADDAKGRVRRALELLGKIVPYRQCALLDAEAGFDPRLYASPPMVRREENELTYELVKLLGKVLEEQALLPPEPAPRTWATHLAVPLIGLGEVVGILFVSRMDGIYEVTHLRILSVVASQLAAYLMILRARAEEAGRTRRLDEAQLAAESATRARDQLVDLVARELRSPLDAARAWVRLLASRNLSRAARARAVEAIERSVRTRVQLFRDLFDVLSPAGLRLELGTVEPAPWLETTVEDLQPLARDRSIRLEATLDRSIEPLTADAARLDEVLSILLTNAFRATPDGGEVQLRLDAAGSGAKIQVTDSGKPFGRGRVLPRLDSLDPRESLIRGDPPATVLTIAKHLVELHGGSLDAKSANAGLGATFTIGLPRNLPPG